MIDGNSKLLHKVGASTIARSTRLGVSPWDGNSLKPPWRKRRTPLRRYIRAKSTQNARRGHLPLRWISKLSILSASDNGCRASETLGVLASCIDGPRYYHCWVLLLLSPGRLVAGLAICGSVGSLRSGCFLLECQWA